MKRILVVDDDETIRDIIKSFLELNAFNVTTASDGHSAISLLNEEKFDLVLADIVMPEISGIDILQNIIESKKNVPVIMITAHGSIQNAVETMKMGCFDYVTKPFILDELLIIINKALNYAKLQHENVRLKQQLKNSYNFKDLTGNSPEINKVYEMIHRVADTDSTVLITGESGTGKEVVAKTIHYNSSRANQPFVPLNCAAIPKDLLESELFGHEKGAFTGALNCRTGRFELAHGGTIFLDEISELDPSLQAKLLRVLQEMEFERVGGVRTIKVDVRVLAATNRDLEKNVKENRFREDLFYRLNVIPIHIPPLRNRTEDIPLFIDHFLHELSKKRKREPLKFSPAVMELLIKYQWPGNVRELKNLVERFTILVSGNTVRVSDLPDKCNSGGGKAELTPEPSGSPEYSSQDIAIPDNGIDLNAVINTLERRLIAKAMEKTGGVRSRAASLLGLNRTTLIEKMKKMGMLG